MLDANEDLTVTVNRGSEPVLVTGSAAVVRAVLDALATALGGPERRELLRLLADRPERPA